jgi:cytochrome c
MHTPLPILVLGLMLAASACGRKEGEPPAQAGSEPAAAPAAAGAELTPFQLKNGIGPVTAEITLGPPDHAMAERGEKTFETKCSACHKFDEKYVGPALGGVLERRTPTYVMNMILDPEGMYTKHPVAKQLLAEHLTQMPNLALSQDEAREIVEYFREAAKPVAK